MDPVDAKRMFAAGREGVFVSVDGGERWAATGAGPVDAVAVAVGPARGGEVYAATSGGVIYRSADSGRTWKGP